MKWGMEMEQVEAMLERIWDLHDKVSDAIHGISRAQFLSSIKTTQRASPDGKPPPGAAAAAGWGEDGRSGFVFVKGSAPAVDDDAATMAEVRSLNAIRTALEHLEYQLEFFHTVQSQQRAERDAAVARLEQSRIALAMRLADLQGKKYKVIEDALAFVGDVHDTDRFVSPENLFEMPGSLDSEDREGNKSNIFMQIFLSSLQLAKKSFKMATVGGVFGNAALFAASMLALLQLHQVALKGENLQGKQKLFYSKRIENNVYQQESSFQTIQPKHFDVFSARG